MAFVQNWLHCVWGTKGRRPYFTSRNKREIVNHILENAKQKGIYIDSINGHKDHLHCIISLNAEQKLAKVMQLIKGESSFWINKNSIVSGKFEWADEYYAVSFGASQLDRVRMYIKNQEVHHSDNTLEEECSVIFSRKEFSNDQG